LLPGRRYGSERAGGGAAVAGGRPLATPIRRPPDDPENADVLNALSS
jgi:hypothetical protein